MAAQPLKLSADPNAPSTLKILATARFAGISIEVISASNETPCGLPAPELLLACGAVVRHTNAILRRVAQTTECGLMGACFFDEGQVDSWLEWASLEVDHAALDASVDVVPICAVLEARLKTRTFLVGQRLTLADVSTACSVRKLLEAKGLDKLRADYPNTVRWLLTCVHQLHLDDKPGVVSGKAAAASPKQKAAASPKQKASASPKMKPAAAPAVSAASGDLDAKIKAVGDEIRELKAKLKAEGLSGKKIDASPEVTGKVKELQELKAAQAAAPAAPAASPAVAPKTAAAKDAAPEGAEGGGKNAAKKAAKEEEKRKKEEEKKQKEEERIAAAEAKHRGPDVSMDDFMSSEFGNLFIQSSTTTGRTWTSVRALNAKLKGKEVWIRGRVHNKRKQGAKMCFLTIRQDIATVQALTQGAEVSGFAGGLPDESVVDILGTIAVPSAAIASCSQSDVEIAVSKIFCIGRSMPLPLQLADAGRPEEDYEKDPTLVRVGQDVRLDNRIIDLRTVANQAIFRIQSGVCTLFREYLLNKGLQEIHSPKLIGGSSEGGADVFSLDYFPNEPYAQKACLAQSPQLYKQMALMTDMPGVFEIGPVFRAEKSFTHRHLCEFTGLDLEMTFKEHYNEVLEVLDGCFNHIFEGLNTRFADEIKAVRAQYPFEPLKWKNPCLRMTFAEAVELLKKKGPKILEERLKAEKSEHEKGVIKRHLESVKSHDIEEDISTEDEKLLGKIIREEYGEELYIIDKFPKDVRPFYTMPDPKDARWTNSYDVFLRGEEITSGAQRIHDPKMLATNAEAKGVPPASIQPYIDAFKYGAFPHAGAGVGMERVVMLFLNLNNIRKTSMFPRDPKRIHP